MSSGFVGVGGETDISTFAPTWVIPLDVHRCLVWGNTLVEAEQPYAFLAMFLCFPTRLHLPYLCVALRKVWGRTPGAVDLGDVIRLADQHFFMMGLIST